MKRHKNCGTTATAQSADRLHTTKITVTAPGLIGQASRNDGSVLARRTTFIEWLTRKRLEEMTFDTPAG